MSLVRYQPWQGMGQLQEDINRLFGSWSNNESTSAVADWVPSVDINESEESFELHVDVPGIDPKDVEITLDNGVLTIAGERQYVKQEKDDSLLRRRTERAYGRFYRRFILPDTVDAEKVKASNHHGVLEITIPKQAKSMPRRIKVAA
ncbi:MAG: Hsp20/alpha crystallin family protein [Woeseia sp.]|nr:Hsp20/alpha crystallin family protein [Woeseia sp.]NNE61168.1 Hsp20/alpha crystallin family protein [Woeseia sp.]